MSRPPIPSLPRVTESLVFEILFEDYASLQATCEVPETPQIREVVDAFLEASYEIFELLAQEDVRYFGAAAGDGLLSGVVPLEQCGNFLVLVDGMNSASGTQDPHARREGRASVTPQEAERALTSIYQEIRERARA